MFLRAHHVARRASPHSPRGAECARAMKREQAEAFVIDVRERAAAGEPR
jgi:hypothetical protein